VNVVDTNGYRETMKIVLEFALNAKVLIGINLEKDNKQSDIYGKRGIYE
jgi:hypothetical protein